MQKVREAVHKKGSLGCTHQEMPLSMLFFGGLALILTVIPWPLAWACFYHFLLESLAGLSFTINCLRKYGMIDQSSLIVTSSYFLGSMRAM